MKKIIYFFIGIIFILTFNSKSLAAYTAPDGNEYEYRYYTNRYTGSDHSNYDYCIYSNYEMVIAQDQVLTGTVYKIVLAYPVNENSSDNYLCTMNSYAYSHLVSVNSISNFDNQGAFSMSNVNGIYITLAGSNGAPTFAGIPAASIGGDFQSFQTSSEAFEYLNQVDLEDVYNLAYPVPNFRINYSSSGYENATNSCVPVQFILDDINDSSFNVELRVKFYRPSTIKWEQSSSTYIYNPSSYEESEYYEIYGIDNPILASALNINLNNDSLLVSFWHDFSELNEQNVVFDPRPTITSVLDDLSNTYFAYNGSSVNNGNRTQIECRYYKTVNGEKIFGNWRKWLSNQPFNYTISNDYNYSQGQVINGNSSSVDPNYQIVDGSGLDNFDTDNVYIYNNNGVPNNQNYPTIADFNRDMLLKGFLETATQLPTFFGDYTNFLTETFSFIPPQIWVIIGLGFTASIVVMILKIL